MSSGIPSSVGSNNGPREYGAAGLFGLLIPQGNPTVEPELRILLPPDCGLLAARLHSPSTDLGRRLADYREQLGRLIEQFGALELDGIGFACTGASYGIDAETEHGQSVPVSKGYPLITAVGAIEAALAALSVRAIALVSPYPPWLTEACRAHWQQRVRVTDTLQLPPASSANAIYGYTTAALLDRITGLDARGADAILLSGTGMPSLRAIQALEPARGIPVLSSNLCLGWALARLVDRARPGPESGLYGGWAQRLFVS